MIDLHSHVLPGLDDGAETIDDALALARAMLADGVTVVAGTPHVRDDYPTSPEAMEAAVAALRAALAEAGLTLDVRGGGEIALDELPFLDSETRARFGLGGNPNLVLIETPYYGWPLGLSLVVAELRSAGIVTVLAHPERNADVQLKPLLLEPVVAAGAYVQLTSASVAGTLGRGPERCSRALLEAGLAHLIGSDAHRPSMRGAGLSSARKALGDHELGRWLTEGLPLALLEGSEPPPRPGLMRSRGRRRWLRS